MSITFAAEQIERVSAAFFNGHDDTQTLPDDPNTHSPVPKVFKIFTGEINCVS